MARTLIVPGLNGSGEGHWQWWWLRDQPGARLVEQEDWARPDAGQWLAALEAAVRASPGAIVVGHSLGTILTARLAESPVAPMVGGAILVAPADIERTSRLHARTYQFGVIPRRRLPFPSILVASRDDIYMSFRAAIDIGTDWGSEIVDLGYAGHINPASGYGRWVEGYRLVPRLAVAGRVAPVETRLVR